MLQMHHQPARHSQNKKKINSIFISVFCYENKEKHPICIKDMLWRKHVDLLLIDEGEKALYLLKTLILA